MSKLTGEEKLKAVVTVHQATPYAACYIAQVIDRDGLVVASCAKRHGWFNEAYSDAYRLSHEIAAQAVRP